MRDQLVAVKVFKVDAPPEQAEQIAEALEAVVHALPRHHGLVELIAAGVERDTAYLVMAHSDVLSLDTRLKPGVPLDPDEALLIVRTLAEAMDAAHGRGIVHGGLHPRDIFVDDRGGCRAAGFGVASALARAGVRVPVRRPYSPPERLTSAPIEPAADRFALGAIAFELLCGRRVTGTGAAAAARCVAPAFSVTESLMPGDADVDPSAPDVVKLHMALAAMLAEQPDHRPSSANAFAQALTLALFPRGVPRGSRAGSASLDARGEDGSDRQGDAGVGADGPSRDDLELFAREGTFTGQGSLWDPKTPAGETLRWETVETVARGEDPLMLFAPESPAKPSDASRAHTPDVADTADDAAAVAARAAGGGAADVRVDAQASDDALASPDRAAEGLAGAAGGPVGTVGRMRDGADATTAGMPPHASDGPEGSAASELSDAQAEHEAALTARPDSILGLSSIPARPAVATSDADAASEAASTPRDGPASLDDTQPLWRVSRADTAGGPSASESARADAAAGAAGSRPAPDEVLGRVEQESDATGASTFLRLDHDDLRESPPGDVRGPAFLDEEHHGEHVRETTSAPPSTPAADDRCGRDEVLIDDRSNPLAFVAANAAAAVAAARGPADRSAPDPAHGARGSGAPADAARADAARTDDERVVSTWSGNAAVERPSAARRDSERVAGARPVGAGDRTDADGADAARARAQHDAGAWAAAGSGDRTDADEAADARTSDAWHRDAGAGERGTGESPGGDNEWSLAASDAADRSASDRAAVHEQQSHAASSDNRAPVSIASRRPAPVVPVEPADVGSSVRVVALVLAVGLAVGGAGGYLLGQRSALRNAASIENVDPAATDASGATTPGGAPAGAEGAGSTADARGGSRAAGAGSVTTPGAPGAPRAAGRGTADTSAASVGSTPRVAPAVGRLTVTSAPSGAEVAIDGTRRGVTPITVRNLPLGPITVRVTRSGYAPETRRVTLAASNPAGSVAFDLARTSASAAARTPAGQSTIPTPDATAPIRGSASGLGALYVVSRPMGARVTVDGRVVGTTPMMLTDVAAGSHTIQIEATGHKPWTTTVQVPAGQRLRVAASLEEGS